MNYYPFHLGDYATATRHLSWDEDAAYRRLLDVYYTIEKPLPADLRAVYRLVLATSEAQRDAVRVVLEEFFEMTESGWRNHRAEVEIDAMREKQQKQRDKANKRWHKPEAEPGIAAAIPQHANDDAAAQKTGADAMPPTPTPTPTPTPIKDNTVGGPALRADPTTPPVDLDPAPNPPLPPPTPPPPFDGTNAEALNGKAVVALASGWDLPDQWGFDAEALGWKPGEVLRESEKFRQYWFSGRGAGTRRSVKGWRQTWSTWLEKASRDKR